MECHDCPHAAGIAAGAFADVPWEETPCAECLRAGRPGAACLTSGKRHVFLDEARTAAPEPADGPGDTLMPVSVLADALGALLRLSAKTLEVVRLRYLGVDYREIAERLGMGRSACTMRVVRALANYPVLMELMPRTKGRVRRRAAGGPRGSAAERRGAGRPPVAGV